MEWGLTILVGAAIVTSVLAWVHWSQQTRVPRLFRNSFIIALRIVALFSGGMWLLCGLLSSTVLDLAFVDVQWRQVVTVFPVVEAGQFVAFEAALAVVGDA